MSWGLCSLEKHTSFYILVVDLSFIVCQSSVRDPDCVRKRQRRNGAEIAIVAVLVHGDGTDVDAATHDS